MCGRMVVFFYRKHNSRCWHHKIHTHTHTRKKGELNVMREECGVCLKIIICGTYTRCRCNSHIRTKPCITKHGETMRFFRFNYNAKFMFGMKVSQFYMCSSQFLQSQAQTQRESSNLKTQKKTGGHNKQTNKMWWGGGRGAYERDMWDVFIGVTRF